MAKPDKKLAKKVLKLLNKAYRTKPDWVKHVFALYPVDEQDDIKDAGKLYFVDTEEYPLALSSAISLFNSLIGANKSYHLSVDLCTGEFELEDDANG